MGSGWLRIGLCLGFVVGWSFGCGNHDDKPPLAGRGSTSTGGAGGQNGGLTTSIEAGAGDRLVDYLGNSAYPDDFWQAATPEQAQVDVVKLEQALDSIQSHRWEVRSFLVARDGRLVFERYGWSSGAGLADTITTPHQVVPSERQPIYSVTKSFTGALVGNAIADGSISGVDSAIVSFFPNYASLNPSAQKATITLADLLTMRSGLTFTEGESAVFAEPRPAESLLSRALATTPGTTWNYSSGDAHIVAEAIHRATGETPLEYGKATLFGPLGIIDPPWGADATGTNTGGFGLVLTAREMARFGELYRNNGLFTGKQIVPASWVMTSTSFKCATAWGMDYGYYWFLPNLYDFFVAIGFNGQQIFVSRNYRLVVVFTGNIPSEEANTDYSELITNYVMPAMQ